MSKQRVYQILYNVPQLSKYKYGNKKVDLGGRNTIREIARKRDNYICQICGKIWQKGTRRFDVHHLDCDKSKTHKYEKVCTIRQ